MTVSELVFAGALYNWYASFTDLHERDRWFKKLDDYDRAMLIQYRLHLRAQKGKVA